ncbi:MAG: type I asparaginase [Bacteroidota bacterium]|nr:type I asparaginase [Bacteroidota bacterium]
MTFQSKSEISLLIIYTGGTIGMVKDPQTGALQPFDIYNLYHHIPVLENYPFNIDSYSFDPLIDSSNITPEFVIKIAEVIKNNYESHDGFVVLHGSDTMAYTASILSFVLENLNKPVILTGSQLPLGVLRSDGRENFINSIEIASANDDGTPLVPEVSICFENELYRGNRTHKGNAEDFGAFKSDNFHNLADIGVNIKYHKSHILKPNFKKLKVHKKLDDNVVVLKLFPGIRQQTVNAILNIKDLRGVIIETYGSGNAPNHQWFLNEIKEAIDKGIIFYSVTQCEGGSVETGKYETSVELYKMGVISGYDITTEAALAKMMYILGRNFSDSEAKELLQKPLRGEMTVL